MQRRSELIVRISFLHYFLVNLPAFLGLAAFAGAITWYYHREVSSVLTTVTFFAVAEPIVMLFRYFCRPTQLRLTGAKMYVTVRNLEQEIVNLRQGDVEIRQNALQRSNDTCSMHLHGVQVNAYAQKNGASILYGVHNCGAVREYIRKHFLK